MADPGADNADVAVEELKRKARRRLVGAIVLALAAATVLPLLLEQDQKPLGDDVSVQIPPVDGGKFVSGLKGDRSGEAASGTIRGAESAPANAPAAPAASAAPTAISAPVPVAPAAAGATAGRAATAAKAETKGTAPGVGAAADAKAGSKDGKPVGGNVTAAGSSTAVANTGAGAAAGSPGSMNVATATPTGSAQASPAATGNTTPGSAANPAAPGSPSPAEAAAATGDAAAAGAAKPEGYVVQLGAFTDKYGANALARKLKKVGYPAYTEPVETSRGTLWRVRVGGYPTRQAAAEARTRLKADGQDGLVTAAK